MYELYKEYSAEKKVQPEKKSVYRSVFNTQLNLSFARKITDTCNKLQNTINNGAEQGK